MLVNANRYPSVAIEFVYSIHETALERVNEIKDLGVILDERMSFLLHIKAIISKRISRELHDPFHGRISNMPLAFGRLTSQFILSSYGASATQCVVWYVDFHGECGLCRLMIQNAF
jgi:hypothetical protein